MQDINVQSIFNKQRSDKFRLIFTLPPVLRSIDNKDFSVSQKNLLNSDSLQFSLYTANIPKVSIPAKTINYSGQTIPITSQARVAYDPVNCKFAVDNRFHNYWVLWKWLAIMNDPRVSGMNDAVSESGQTLTTGSMLPSQNLWDYQTVMTISMLDEYNTSVCDFKFFNAFVTDLSRLDLNFQTEDDLQADFTFSFGQMDVVIKD